MTYKKYVATTSSIKERKNIFLVIMVSVFRFVKYKFYLIHHLIGAAAAGKGFRLGFKGKAHTQDIAHRFP